MAQLTPLPSLPGPSSSSSKSNSNSFIPFRDIYEHLELARHQRDASEIQLLLESRKQQLQQCALPFTSSFDALKPTSSSDTVTLPDGSSFKLDENHKVFCQRISQRFGMDLVEAFILLRTFLQSEETSLDLLLKPKSASDVKQSRYSFASTHPTLATTTTANPNSNSHTLSSSSKTSNAEIVSDFMDALNVFYFDERMYILRIVCSLLRISQDEQHEYFDLANHVLSLFTNDQFGLECIQRFQQLTTQSLPDQVRQQPRYSTFWAKQSLKEQFGLLEVVFLLFYDRLQASPALIVSFIQALQSTQDGRLQANMGFFDAEAIELMACIGHLLILIGVEVLSLEEVMDGLDLSKPEAPFFVADAEKLGLILDLLEQTGQDPTQSPLLLAWALVLSRIQDALSQIQEQSNIETVADFPPHLVQLAETIRTQDGGPPIWRRLAQAAFAPEMRLFDTMLSILASPLLTSSNSTTALAVVAPSALAYRAVFKGLVLTVTELVKPEFLSNFDSLIDLWEATFGSGIAIEQNSAAIQGVAALCDQFWQIDAHFQSRCATIETARRRWPVSFRPLVRIIKALSGHARVDPLQAWPTSLRPKAHSELEERACFSVFRYLSQIPTFAQVLPDNPSAAGAAPYQTLEGGNYTSVTYQINRPVRIPGTQVRLPVGTIGSAISELGKTPVIVLWSPPQPISGWKLMRDILASFPPYLAAAAIEQTAMSANDAHVFKENRFQPVDFNKLSPVDADHPWEQVAAEILELFASVLSASPKLAWTLLAHLEGKDVSPAQNGDMQEITQLEQPQPTHSKDLALITINLIQHALVETPIHTRLIESAYRLLAVLLPYLPNQIWQTIRSSNILFGSPGSVSYLASRDGNYGPRSLQTAGSSSSLLLAQEATRGSYNGLLSLLDFLIVLVYELRSSHFVWSNELLQVKASVLIRALGWVFESVWPEYQSWKYARLRDKLEIGLKCTTLFEATLVEKSYKLNHVPGHEQSAGPAAGVIEAVERALVTHASMLYISPLITCLGTGQQLVDQLHRAGRQADAILAEELILVSLRLAKLIVTRRRESTTAATAAFQAAQKTETTKRMARIEFGLLEHLFFQHTTVATRTISTEGRKSVRIELATAVMGYVLLPISSAISSEASKLITTICRSVADMTLLGQQVPGLVGHLGTISELEATMAGLVSLVANTHQDAGLRADVWAMLGAIVDTQPALATLLLTGRHLAKTTEIRLAGGSLSQDKDSKANGATPSSSSTIPVVSSTYGQALDRNALEVASESVLIWQELFQSNPHLLESILRFLNVAWSHAPEHVSAFDSLRRRKIFFDALGELVGDTIEIPTSLPQGFIDTDDTRRTDAHDRVRQYCFRRMCQARALQLLERDVQLEPADEKQLDGPDSDKPSLSTLLSLLVSPKKLNDAIESCFRMPCHPEFQHEAERKLAEGFPTVNMASLRHPARKDDFDTDRMFGENYLYDIEALRRKLEGFYETLSEEDVGDLATLEEGVLCLAMINLDWSCIDVQTTCLRAWTQAIHSTMGRVVTQLLPNHDRIQAFEQSCLEVWTTAAEVAADENREGDFIRGVHATRLALLAALMELAWGRPVQGSTSENVNSNSIPLTTATNNTPSNDETVEKASKLAARLLSHPTLTVDDSIKGLSQSCFHREVFAMVLFCSLRCRAVLTTKKEEKKKPTASLQDARSTLHSVIDHFSRYTIVCLRTAIDNCLRCVQTGQQELEQARMYEDDLDLFVSVLELLIRPDVELAAPHGWLEQIQQVQLFHAAIDLLSRAPVIRSHDSYSLPSNHAHTIIAGGRTDPSFISRFSSTLLPSGPSLSSTAHHPLYVMPILSLLLCFSNHPMSSEQLALEGVVNGLSLNQMSEYLESGTVNALLLSGDTNPMHECWTMMLRIVINLIDSLGGGSEVGNWSGASSRFIETDVEGLVRVYNRQLSSCLELTRIHSVLNGSSSMMMMSMDHEEDQDRPSHSRGKKKMTTTTKGATNEVVSLGMLDELELIVRLVYGIVRSDSERNRSNRTTSTPYNKLRVAMTETTTVNGNNGGTVATTLSFQFSEKVAKLIQPLVYLVQHPRELSILLGLGMTNEFEIQQSKQIELTATLKIRSILTVSISTLWVYTRTTLVLSRERESWPSTRSGLALIQPTTRTSSCKSQTTAASLGTLLDLASYFTDYLRNVSVSPTSSSSSVVVGERIDSKNDQDQPDSVITETEQIQTALEQILGIAAAQAAVWANGSEPVDLILQQRETSARQEIEAGFSRDLVVAIRAAKEVIRKHQPNQSSNSSIALLAWITRFVQDKLGSSRSF